MLSRNQVKHVQSLKQKKFREIHQQFIVEGSKLVMEFVNSQYQVLAIYAVNDWLLQHEPYLNPIKVPIIEVSFEEMERITALSSPSPVMAITDIPPSHVLPSGKVNDLILALDDIKDPGNFGTIIRVADWFGVELIICSENSVDLYNPKVIQATMGSVTRVNVVYCNLPQYLDSLDRDTKVYGTFPEGDSIYCAELRQQGIIIIGSESFGISPEVISKVTDKISIPPFGETDIKDHAESLNASIATAIICSEFRRRNS